mmetsp:Transcript_5503/g.15776  ORF Transcript_5503/g.15776 Transcript_5503/m.15776 type:complete len:408 (-) Transcript_5503:101-1324(-)
MKPTGATDSPSNIKATDEELQQQLFKLQRHNEKLSRLAAFTASGKSRQHYCRPQAQTSLAAVDKTLLSPCCRAVKCGNSGEPSSPAAAKALRTTKGVILPAAGRLNHNPSPLQHSAVVQSHQPRPTSEHPDQQKRRPAPGKVSTAQEGSSLSVHPELCKAAAEGTGAHDADTKYVTTFTIRAQQHCTTPDAAHSNTANETQQIARDHRLQPTTVQQNSLADSESIKQALRGLAPKQLPAFHREPSSHPTSLTSNKRPLSHLSFSRDLKTPDESNSQLSDHGAACLRQKSRPKFVGSPIKVLNSTQHSSAVKGTACLQSEGTSERHTASPTVGGRGKSSSAAKGASLLHSVGTAERHTASPTVGGRTQACSPGRGSHAHTPEVRHDAFLQVTTCPHPCLRELQRRKIT